MAAPEASRASAPASIRDWCGALRPKHWLKNIFVLAPLVFTENDRTVAEIFAAAAVFGVFCLACSGFYVINDLVDRPADALHPRKRNRAVAAGRISAPAAATMAFVLVTSAAVFAEVALPPKARWFLAAYAANTLLYIFWLKNRVILDVLLIAVGFLVRILAGCAAVGVEPSGWIELCGFSLALVLGFGKRRTEVGSAGVSENFRATLISYDAAKLNTLMAVCTAVCLIAYMLYTVSPETVQRHGTRNLLYTVPVVAYGLFRYLFKAMEAGADGPTEILVGDPVFAVTGFVWGLAVLAALTWK